MDRRTKLPPQDVEKAVLRHPEAIQTAIICGIGLIVMVRILVGFLQRHDYFDAVYIIVLWIVAFLAVASLFAWSIAGSTVVKKSLGRLTISLAVGGLVIWEVGSVSLADLTDVFVRERTYGYKGKRIHRFQVMFGKTGHEKELLGFLNKENSQLLVSGILKEFLKQPD